MNTRAALLSCCGFFLLVGCDLPSDTGSSGGDSDSEGDSDADWQVAGLEIARDRLNYAEVSGTVTLQTSYAGLGTQAEARYYEDEYQTLIVTGSDYVGGDLEEEGETQAFEITHYQVYVTPAIGGYDKVCAEFRADDSNFEDWKRVGCLE